MSDLIEQTAEAIKKLQNFDLDLLPRARELGEISNFQAAVEPARKLKELYQRLSTSSLSEIPDQLLSEIRTQAESDYGRFQRVLDFDPQRDQDPSAKAVVINGFNNSYYDAFRALYPYISCGASRSVDLKNIEEDARATLTTLFEGGAKRIQDIEEANKQAQQVLNDMRGAAGQLGVTRQATFFAEEAKSHDRNATVWMWVTVGMAVMVSLLAFLSLFLHTIEGLRPRSAIDSYQLIASKFLIFGVASYMLILSARNFMSNKHNAVLNKHRENALMTFEALADAATDNKLKDVILTHASACIFSPQETGYSKASGFGSVAGGKSVIELIQGAAKTGE